MASNTRSKPFPGVASVRNRTGLNQTEFWGKVYITQSAGSRYEIGFPMHPSIRALIGHVYMGETIKRHSK